MGFARSSQTSSRWNSKRSEEPRYPITASNVESLNCQQKGSEGMTVGKRVAGEHAVMLEDPSKAGGASAGPLLQEQHSSCSADADGPHFPKSTLKNPLKAPVLPVWGLDETCAALDVLCNRSELTENGETNRKKKGILKFGRKKQCTKPTRTWVSLHKTTYGCIP